MFLFSPQNRRILKEMKIILIFYPEIFLIESYVSLTTPICGVYQQGVQQHHIIKNVFEKGGDLQLRCEIAMEKTLWTYLTIHLESCLRLQENKLL